MMYTDVSSKVRFHQLAFLGLQSKLSALLLRRRELKFALTSPPFLESSEAAAFVDFQSPREERRGKEKKKGLEPFRD